MKSQDRKALIRLASSLPKGSKERKSVLAGLQKQATTHRDVSEEYARFLGGLREAQAGLTALSYMLTEEGFSDRDPKGMIKDLQTLANHRELEKDVTDLIQTLMDKK